VCDRYLRFNSHIDLGVLILFFQFRSYNNAPTIKYSLNRAIGEPYIDEKLSTSALPLSFLQVYSDCRCIAKPPIDLSLDSQTNSSWSQFEAQNVACHSSCNYLWPFVGLAFCVMVCTFVATMPALSATLRYQRAVYFLYFMKKRHVSFLAGVSTKEPTFPININSDT